MFYNNAPDSIVGTLQEAPGIPVVGISGEDGEAIAARLAAGEEIQGSVQRALSDRLDGDAGQFAEAVAAAADVLYLADNAGEIVFDRLLIEQIGPGRTTVVVRGAPTINDATMADAEMTGLTGAVEVIDNGSDAPGTILEDCSPEFRDRFERADLVLSKGQGNYETLSGVAGNIFFLLQAKCPLIARHLDCPVGAMVVRRAAAVPAEEASQVPRALGK